MRDFAERFSDEIKRFEKNLIFCQILGSVTNQEPFSISSYVEFKYDLRNSSLCVRMYLLKKKKLKTKIAQVAIGTSSFGDASNTM